MTIRLPVVPYSPNHPHGIKEVLAYEIGRDLQRDADQKIAEELYTQLLYLENQVEAILPSLYRSRIPMIIKQRRKLESVFKTSRDTILEVEKRCL